MDAFAVILVKFPAFLALLHRYDFYLYFAELNFVRGNLEVAFELLLLDLHEVSVLVLHLFLLLPALLLVHHLDHLELVALVLFDAVLQVQDQVPAPLHLDVVQSLGFAFLLHPLLHALHELLHPVLLREQLFVQSEQQHDVVEVVVGSGFRLADEVPKLRDDLFELEFLVEILRGNVFLSYQPSKCQEISLDKII